jgi:transcriptional regulator with XRE-family HTH domain
MDNHTARKRLAENVRVLRLLRGWSQEVLAEIAQLDRSYVGGIERGKRNVSLDNIERLATAFDLSVPELLQSLDAHAIGERLLAKVRHSMKS